jgi:hypothetical protein
MASCTAASTWTGLSGAVLELVYILIANWYSRNNVSIDNEEWIWVTSPLAASSAFKISVSTVSRGIRQKSPWYGEGSSQALSDCSACQSRSQSNRCRTIDQSWFTFGCFTVEFTTLLSSANCISSVLWRHIFAATRQGTRWPSPVSTRRDRSKALRNEIDGRDGFVRGFGRPQKGVLQ